MNTQTKSGLTAGPEGWAGIDEQQFRTQRSGGGFLTLLLFPMIAFVALLYAASELAK